MRTTLALKVLGKYFPVLKIAMAAVFCSCLFSGCITSSPEDDYVAGVMAEAMQGQSPSEEVAVSQQPVVTVARTPAETKPAAVSAPVPPPVSIAVPPPVSIAAPPETVAAPVETPVAAPVETGATPVAVSVPTQTVAAVSGSEGSGQKSETQAPKPETRPPGRTERDVLPRPSIPTIQPDSVLWISVAEDPSLNGRYVVNESSAIDFAYVGLVFLTGMTVEQAEVELKRILEGRYLKTVTLSVKLAKSSYDKVGVLGTVGMPGEIKIGAGATISLSEALRRAGGLQGDRENCRVKIVRGGLKTPFGPAAQGEVYPFATEDGVLKVPSIFLRNEDMAYVFTPSQATSGGLGVGGGNKKIILLGEVPRRGVVEFGENEPCTLMYLLFKIGGLPRFAKANKITVVRRSKDGTEKTFVVDGEKLLDYGRPEDDLVLETGDRIMVPARKISFF